MELPKEDRLVKNDILARILLEVDLTCRRL